MKEVEIQSWDIEIVLPDKPGEYLIFLKKPFMGINQTAIASFTPGGFGFPRFIVVCDKGNNIFIPANMVESWVYTK